jgi:hypothetical protein
MKKLIAVAAVAGGLSVSPLCADQLKESLSGLLKKKEETPSMVNLDGLNLNGKVKPIIPKTRSSKAVIAVVDGHKIIKKEADAYLKQRTKGKVTDFDLLPKEQRLALVKELVLPQLLTAKAKKELTEEQKDALISRAWMQNAVAESDIPEEQLKAAYEKIKAQAKAKSALQQVPPFEKIRDRIKMQVAEQQIVGQLLRGVDIKVEPSSDKVAGYIGMLPVSIDKVNRALQMMTKGKMTWETLPEQEKNRVLQMMAPSKMIALNAKNTLTQEQQDTVLVNFWMQKGISQVEITDAEVKKRYEKIKKMAKKSKGKKRLPDYAELEKSLKMQLAQEKFVDSLIKEAKIKLK